MSCITLLSDFGLQDASVASAKGILMQHMPDASLVDISHLVEPYHLQQAAYLTLAAYRHFPKGTCHVLLFDVFYDRKPRLLLCEKDGHYFLAPDNGVLALAFGEQVETVWCCFEMESDGVFHDWLHAIGKTIRTLQTSGQNAPDLVPCRIQTAPVHWQPRIEDHTVECQVIHIDRFENVVLNINREQFETIGKGRPFRIEFMRDEEITQISTHYFNVAKGEKLCRFNATGFLEIAINRGNAASLFGLKLYRDQDLLYKTIKIYFG
ncbi:SAM hydrolase/SAM-dependent halogenase family protein [Chitinophagaceae bacterium MMS25-I14]